MPRCYLLCGVPASGKSTYRNKALMDFDIHSTDDLLDRIALAEAQTYSEVFSDNIEKVEKLFWQNLKDAIDENRDIAVDRTNISKKSRKRILDLLPDEYEATAVIFTTPEWDELTKRLNSRPGKTIPEKVVKQMIDNYQRPTLDEGFRHIIEIN